MPASTERFAHETRVVIKPKKSPSGLSSTAKIATALRAAFERAEEDRRRPAMGRWLTAYYLFAAGFDSWDFGEIGWELVCGKVFNPHFD